MPAHPSFYDLSFRAINGDLISLAQFKGKRVLLVNTASECGYTPQYKELQSLHEQHGDNIVIIGFPANNFGEQEPADNASIANFCERNFGVTFLLAEKSDVIGDKANAVFKWLGTKELNGWNEEKPNWNFCKYLVDTKGELTAFYSSAVSPLSAEIVG